MANICITPHILDSQCSFHNRYNTKRRYNYIYFGNHEFIKICSISLSLIRRRITKMDKATGLKVTFMSKHPEISSLWDLAIYADDVVDGELVYPDV